MCPPPVSDDCVAESGIAAPGATGDDGTSSTAVGANGSPTTRVFVSGELWLPESSTTTSDTLYWPVGRPGALNVGLVVTTGARLPTVHRYWTIVPPTSLE